MRTGSHALGACGSSSAASDRRGRVVAAATQQRKTVYLKRSNTSAEPVEVGSPSGLMRALADGGCPGGHLKDVRSNKLVYDFETANDGATYVAMPRPGRHNITLAVALEDGVIERTTFETLTQGTLVKVLDRYGAIGFREHSGGPVLTDVMRMSDGGGPYPLVVAGKPTLSV